MEFTAKSEFLRVSPRKLNAVAQLVRGQDVQKALDRLRFTDRRWSKKVMALIESAVNSASQVRAVNVDNLFVKTIQVGPGPTLKRFLTRARGSASQILKRTSNITVILKERK